MKIEFERVFSAGMFVFLFVVMTGCSKSDGGANAQGEYYLRYKVNGSLKEYRQAALSNFNSKSGDDYITVCGAQAESLDPDKNIFVIGLTTVGENQFHQNYTNYATTASGYSKAKLLLFTGSDENGVHFQSWGDEFVSVAPTGADLKCTVIIDEATSSYIKGHFSGVVYEADFKNKKIITEGEFYLEED